MFEYKGKKFMNEQEAIYYLLEENLKLKQSMGGALPDPIAGPQGPTGNTGATGPQGPQGTGVYGCAAGLPSPTAYKEGDFYLLFNGNLYKKITGVWVLQTNLKGPQGPVGLEGGTQVVANPAGSPTDNLEKVEISGTVYNIISSGLRTYLATLYNNGSPLIEYSGTKVEIPNNLEVDGHFYCDEEASFRDDISVQGHAFFDNGLQVNGDTLDEITDSQGNPLVICERITDANDNFRFIEHTGLASNTISGFVSTYCKWSLSGSHLMCVLAGSIASGSIIGVGASLAIFELPEFIKDKILGVQGSLIEYKAVDCINNSYVPSTLQLYFEKYTDGVRINAASSYTAADNVNFRAQFDLLIDMA